MPDRFSRAWRGGDLGKAVTLVRRLPVYLRLIWGLLRDRRVPLRQKGLLLLLLGYLVSPLDVIPDFIPVLGQLDDVAVTLLVLDLFIRNAPKEVVDDHLARIARNEDDLRRDLDLAARVLGENFTHLRDNLQRVLERRGARSRSGERAVSGLGQDRQGDRYG